MTKTDFSRWLNRYHLRHHFVNEMSWFGVSNPTMDIIYRSYNGGPDDCGRSITTSVPYPGKRVQKSGLWIAGAPATQLPRKHSTPEQAVTAMAKPAMCNFAAMFLEPFLDLNQAALRVIWSTSPFYWMHQLLMMNHVADKKKSVTEGNRNDVATDLLGGGPMYTLQKAKEEIDAIAKHATDIAAHALAMDDNFEAKLESFKKEIISTIELKFAELEKTILGDAHNVETSALADLGAKVSQLMHGSATHSAPGQGGGTESNARPHTGEIDSHQGYQTDSNQGFQPDQHHHQ
jgi:hypothetical protein